MPTEVRFVYSGIRVRNLARSLRFYRKLGFRVVQRGSFSHGGRWVHLTHPSSDHRLELNFYPRGTPFYEPFRPGGEFDHFGFFAADPLEWLRTTVRAGAKPTVGFIDGDTQLLFVQDPDGVWLGVYGPAEPPKKKRRTARQRRPG
ncbi:MAG: VOC family protein [Thermoplasmata archaeon]|nr:VOC family protein [Thermoplasmata archaeon]